MKFSFFFIGSSILNISVCFSQRPQLPTLAEVKKCARFEGATPIIYGKNYKSIILNSPVTQPPPGVDPSTEKPQSLGASRFHYNMGESCSKITEVLLYEVVHSKFSDQQEIRFSSDFLNHPAIAPFVDFEPSKARKLPEIEGFLPQEVRFLKDQVLCDRLSKVDRPVTRDQQLLDQELHLDLEPGLEIYSDTTVVHQIVPSNRLSGGIPDSLFQFNIPDYKNKYEAYKKRREHTEKAFNAMRTLFRCNE